MRDFNLIIDQPFLWSILGGVKNTMYFSRGALERFFIYLHEAEHRQFTVSLIEDLICLALCLDTDAFMSTPTHDVVGVVDVT